MKQHSAGRALTGMHVTVMLVCFFATILAVNLLMASLATRTFGGTVVASSYVASQRYNQWLEAGRAQESKGWSAEALVDKSGHVALLLKRSEAPVTGADVTLRLEHPLGRKASVELPVREAGEGSGQYISTHPLPVGRWHAFISASDGDMTMRTKLELLR